jgi:hypothetical protein
LVREWVWEIVKTALLVSVVSPNVVFGIQRRHSEGGTEMLGHVKGGRELFIEVAEKASYRVIIV